MGAEPLPAGAGAAADAGQAEKAIRANVDAFVQAYNAADAEAIAQLFTADGQIADEHGNAAWGREAIAQVFRQIFKNHPQSRIENTIQSVRLLNASQAVEDGTTTVTHAPGEPAQCSRYQAVHVQREGRWLMASAIDLPEPAANAQEQLKQLEWLIGDWVDESRDGLIVTSYRWAEGGRYIVSQYQLKIKGRPALQGTQWIGWDPLQKAIRSWTFDSEGGFAEGLWSKQEQAWVVKMTGFTADGKSASATNTWTRLGKDRISWQSRERILGGEKSPDIDAVIVVRRPPPPK